MEDVVSFLNCDMRRAVSYPKNHMSQSTLLILHLTILLNNKNTTSAHVFHHPKTTPRNKMIVTNRNRTVCTWRNITDCATDDSAVIENDSSAIMNSLSETVCVPRKTNDGRHSEQEEEAQVQGQGQKISFGASLLHLLQCICKFYVRCWFLMGDQLPWHSPSLVQV